jgi:hypothetical protein
MLNTRRHKEKAQEGYRIINQNLNVGSNDVSSYSKDPWYSRIIIFYYIVIKPYWHIKNVIIFYYKKLISFIN